MRRFVIALLSAAFGTTLLIGAKAYSGSADPSIVVDAPLDPAATGDAAGDPGLTPSLPAAIAPTTPSGVPASGAPVTSVATAPAPPAAATRTIVGTAFAAKGYGSVQVQVVMTGSHIDDVQVLKMSNRPLNAPTKLRQEALAKQSAQLSNVSGATYTCQAYMQSLESALAKA
jgi:uncharacterized protein with FMN-binding domain